MKEHNLVMFVYVIHQPAHPLEQLLLIFLIIIKIKFMANDNFSLLPTLNLKMFHFMLRAKQDLVQVPLIGHLQSRVGGRYDN